MSGRGGAVTACLAVTILTAACSSTPSPSRMPAATAGRHSPTPAPATATPATALTVAALQSLYARIDPANPARCTGAGTTPSFAACPLTPRLVAALDASLAARSGPGADPLCGCQAYDPQQQVAFTLDGPGTGTIRVTSFGAALVSYTVVASGGGYLIDDIVYCTPDPHSIYPAEAVTAC